MAWVYAFLFMTSWMGLAKGLLGPNQPAQKARTVTAATFLCEVIP